MDTVLHVEVVLKPECNLNETTIRNYIRSGLESEKTLVPGRTFKDLSNQLLSDNVESIHISECGNEFDAQSLNVADCELKIHVYKLDSEGAQTEGIESGDGDGQELEAASHWVLPSQDFHGLWENLIYESNIKQNLLSFMETTLLFSERDVSPNVISWNRVVLLHGPPGTGKTSLCKALAQKLSIRLAHHYTHGQLLEINSHSLFSKWFSESGKLVSRMFAKIRELIDNPRALVIVLIDEVESLTHARQSAANGTEPSDAIRTVNAVLTQIDNLRRYPNVLILTTSNVTHAIDLAFVDRADIKQYIGPPTEAAVYKIFCSCINELSRTGIIAPNESLYSFATTKALQPPEDENVGQPNSLFLLKIARMCIGLSGRTLRKLPFLAHALYVRQPSTSLHNFLVGLEEAIRKHKDEMGAITKN